jgi:antimicrobial peptide system SdpB family protein
MKHPWTNVYGTARTVLALGLLWTLTADGIDILFQPSGFRATHEISPYYRLSLFHLLAGSPAQLELARWISVAALGLVASGWRPRLTAPLHWWIAFSFAVSTTVAEGGDQIHAILALLILPIALTDSRRSHWSEWSPDPLRTASHVKEVIASSAMTMIRLQVAVIYFHAAVAKLAVGEWENGTAVYYWFTHPVYGMTGWVRTLALPVLEHPVGVVVLTWGVVLLEVVLAAALVMAPRHRAPLLVLGLVFHAGIVVAHGLFSFFFAMAGALILYLRPADVPFRLSVAGVREWLHAEVARAFSRVRRPSAAGLPPA